MTQTKEVITKRMDQKANVSILGTSGRVEKGTKPAPTEPEQPKEILVIATPKSSKKNARKRKQ